MLIRGGNWRATWAEFVAAALTEAGWTRSTTSPGFYFKTHPSTSTLLHGDDFISEGTAEELDELDRVLAERMQVKMLGRIGPGCPQVQAKFLKRVIEWRGDRYVYYGNTRHADEVL